MSAPSPDKILCWSLQGLRSLRETLPTCTAFSHSRRPEEELRPAPDGARLPSAPPSATTDWAPVPHRGLHGSLPSLAYLAPQYGCPAAWG